MRTIVASLLMVATSWPAALAATSFTGVIYSYHGGVSSTASGWMRLAVGNQVYFLTYQKPYPQDFSRSDCWFPGTIWTIEAEIREDGHGILLGARCDGEQDEFFGAAVSVVREFFRLVSGNNFENAYDLFTSSYRTAHPYSDFIAEVENLNLNWYEQYGGQGKCLDILERTAENAVRLEAGIDCGIERKGEYYRLYFVVEQEQTSEQFQIGKLGTMLL